MISQVKLLLQLADTLVEKGHAHAPNIKQWVEEVKKRKTTQDLKFVFWHHNDITPQTFSLKVDDTYKNFSTRMDKYREKV